MDSIVYTLGEWLPRPFYGIRKKLDTLWIVWGVPWIAVIIKDLYALELKYTCYIL